MGGFWHGAVYLKFTVLSMWYARAQDEAEVSAPKHKRTADPESTLTGGGGKKRSNSSKYPKLYAVLNQGPTSRKGPGTRGMGVDGGGRGPRGESGSRFDKEHLTDF